MRTRTPPPTQRRFRTSWGELRYVCKKVHYWLHVRSARAVAKRYEVRLERLLTILPKSKLAILRAEGLALLHELRDDIAKAVKQRTRQLRLIARLHRSLDESNHDEDMRSWILQDWGAASLRERQRILQHLTERSGR